MKPLSRIVIALLVAGSVVWSMHRGSSRAMAAGTAAAPQATKETWPLPISVPGEQNPEIKQLDNQLTALRKDLHSQIDPLEAQIKTLRDKYDPQILSVEQRRKDLVEQGKPAAIQELDRQEDGELAALAEKEKSDLEQVKQRYADQRKGIRQHYDELRRQALAAK
jgi:hypothetical protein